MKNCPRPSILPPLVALAALAESGELARLKRETALRTRGGIGKLRHTQQVVALPLVLAACGAINDSQECITPTGETVQEDMRVTTISVYPERGMSFRLNGSGEFSTEPNNYFDFHCGRPMVLEFRNDSDEEAIGWVGYQEGRLFDFETNGQLRAEKPFPVTPMLKLTLPPGGSGTIIIKGIQSDGN